jgi:hypothetical protein
MRELSARLLRERTGQEVEAWNQHIKREGFADEPALRAWLAAQDVCFSQDAAPHLRTHSADHKAAPGPGPAA